MSTASGPLTPNEHDEMRDVVLAGTQRIRPAGSRRSAAIAVAASLLVVGGIAGGAVAFAMNGVDAAPATTPTPTMAAGCPDRLAAWVTLGDEFDVEEEPREDVPAALAPYVVDAGGVTCSFASADESVSVVALVVAEEDAAEHFDEIRDALALDPFATLVAGQENVANFLFHDGSGRQSVVHLRDAMFSRDVGLESTERVIMVFDRPFQLSAPTECVSHITSPIESDPGGEALARAATAAILPPGVALSPGIAVTAAAEPGRFDATANLCGDRLTHAELVAAGNVLAAALASDPSSATLATLTIVPWRPIEGGAIASDPEGVALRTDFGSFDRTDAGSVPDTAWE